ncbi:MAG: apolipoprotein N-acyltransferase [Verrucomicrobia bacterium]|nr:apolipoprotein N-acyltransferase [Verrucomicrobiota bacterium]MBU6445836.1 apolipoprotein N-acyltransferase [Verrucomicrobiota bacterium]MDE3046741.1 apolipoprotein N-acyltransferase [Verrucomicrobiota bacterium]
MNYFWIALGFLLTAFGQPAWISGFGSLAALFGYALFWKGMLSLTRLRTRFILAVFWFAAVQGVQLSWLATPDYMGPFIIPFTLFLALGLGVQFGILSRFVSFPMSWSRLFALAGVWAIFEYSRLFFLCGYTWNPAGLALTDTLYSLQFASVWGIFGLSFWVILVNLALLKAWTETSKKQAALGVSLALLPYLYGFAQIAWVDSWAPVSHTLKVALVQTNWAPEEKDFDPKMPGAHVPPLHQWKEILTALPMEQECDLIILPEAAFPLGAFSASYELASVMPLFDPEVMPPLVRPFAIFHRDSWRLCNAFLAQALANQFHAHVILGLDDRDREGKYNAAFHFIPFGAMPKRYEKQILAPIGEYIPLGQWRKWAQWIGEQYGIYSSFHPGKEGKIFHAQVPIGISICLEETFPDLMRQLRVKGAELFVSVSNDAFFPRTKLARQHFDHGRVRAVENGIPLLRSCNSGITCGIDGCGRPLSILSASKNTKTLFFSFPVRSYKTLYTFWGDAGILSSSFALIAINLLLSRKKKLP